MCSKPVFRFAPSPNGLLHPGHACSALYSHKAALAAGGRFLLRIEDIDPGRCRPHFEDAIIEDLKWLGLNWEEPVRRQSEHMEDYASALASLEAMGVVYPCFATRKEIASAVSQIPNHPADPDGAPVYPGICTSLTPREQNARIISGKPYNMRLSMPRAIALAHEKTGAPITFTEEAQGPRAEHGHISISPQIWGDIIIARKEIPTSYHLSVVVDDAIQNISHVTRGQDLFYATPIHRLLQILLELPAPIYRHHPLVRDAKGRRLSKSAKDISLRALRLKGMTPDEIQTRWGLV